MSGLRHSLERDHYHSPSSSKSGGGIPVGCFACRSLDWGKLRFDLDSIVPETNKCKQFPPCHGQTHPFKSFRSKSSFLFNVSSTCSMETMQTPSMVFPASSILSAI